MRARWVALALVAASCTSQVDNPITQNSGRPSETNEPVAEDMVEASGAAAGDTATSQPGSGAGSSASEESGGADAAGGGAGGAANSSNATGGSMSTGGQGVSGSNAAGSANAGAGGMVNAAGSSGMTAGASSGGSAGVETGGADTGGAGAGGLQAGGSNGGGGTAAGGTAGNGGGLASAGMAGATPAGGMGGSAGADSQPETYRYARLVAESEVNDGPWTSIAELDLLDENGTPLDRSGWSVAVDSEETVDEDAPGTNAIDGDTDTFWHTEWSPDGSEDTPTPHEIVIDLGTAYELSELTGFVYLPRQDGRQNGRIADYSFYLSSDGQDWKTAIKSGTLANSAAAQTVNF